MNRTDSTLSPAALLSATLLVLALPAVFADGFGQRLAAEMLLLGTAAMSLGLLVGFGGMVSLGHAAVFGSAAYAAALAAPWTGGALLPTLALGLATGLVTSVAIGLLALRVQGLFFLVLTLVAGQIVWEIVFRWHDVTGGADGLRGFGALSLHGHDLTSPLALYTTSAALALAAAVVARAFLRAPLGRALVGSREQPLRMRALGYSLGGIRLAACAVAGGIAGAAGALYPFVNQYLGPSTVHWSLSATLIIMLVIGGTRSLWGGYIGAAAYLAMQTYVSSWTDRWQLLVGLVFVATVLLMPQGAAHAVGGLVARLRKQP